jgi:hypothetical protein
MVDSLFSPSDKKIMQMFAIVGLKEGSVTKYDDMDNNVRYIQNIDIVKKSNCEHNKTHEKDNEKWSDYITIGCYWMRIVNIG